METDSKKKVKTADAVSAYNSIKALKIGKLPKEEQFKVLRAARILKPIAAGFEDFVKDAQERLKPDDFADIADKSQRFAELTDEEKIAVNKAAAAYQRDVDECVRPEFESEKEVAWFEPLSEDSFAQIASENESVDVQTLLALQDILGQ